MPEDKTSDQGKIPAEIQKLEVELQSIKKGAEEVVVALEALRTRADDGATYASQAKANAEDHAKSAAQLKGAAEADINAISAHKKSFEELVAATTLAKAGFEANNKAIGESRKAVELVAAKLEETLATASARIQKIEETKTATDALRIEAERSQTAVASAKSKSETFQTQSEQSTAKINGFLGQVTKQADEVSANTKRIGELLKEGDTKLQNIASIVERLEQSDSVSTKHEKRVLDLETQLEELNKKAEGFLPGATSAGLAHSFNAQMIRFAEPQRRWLRTFIWCIVGLVVVAAPSFLMAVLGPLFNVQADKGWEELLKGMAMRLPIVIPLVWLAIYAGRNYMLSVRLEEEYAYKEAISRAFEGYKREMDKTGSDDPANPSPLTRFCLSVLTAITERPGRIYEGKQKDISILNELTEATKQADELRRQKIASH